MGDQVAAGVMVWRMKVSGTDFRVEDGLKFVDKLKDITEWEL